MNSGFGKVRGWAQQMFWTPGGGPTRLDGPGGDPDPLNTAALSVWGFMRAGFGVVSFILICIFPAPGGHVVVKPRCWVKGAPCCAFDGAHIAMACI
jgi:hypothetical protein